MNKNRQICVLCGLTSGVSIVSKPKLTSLSKLIECAMIKIRNKSYTQDNFNVCERLSNSTPDNLQDVSYHRICYRDFTLLSRSELRLSELSVEEFIVDFIEKKVLNECSCVDLKTISNEYIRLVPSAIDNTVRKKVRAHINSRDDVFLLSSTALNQFYSNTKK